MMNKIEPILLQKQKEIEDLYQKIEQQPEHPLAKVLHNNAYPKQAVSFKQAIQASSFSVIAEIKRQSPSKGMLAPIPDPSALAERYILSGASALSVLTDQPFFGGSLHDLIQVARYAAKQNIPVLRKDFIVDAIQIAEAALSGASAVLLIVAVLGNKIKPLLEFAHSLQLDVLVEIHDENELQIALSSGADIIGINNRDLKTFVVDTEHALNLRKEIPDHIIKVAESGITQPLLANRYRDAGFHAVLIGEALVKSDNPKQFIEACCHG